MNDGGRFTGVALQPLAKLWMQGIEIHVFNGNLLPAPLGAVLTGAALGLPDALPVGGSVAGCAKTLPLHKGLQQIDGMTVFGLPVPTQPPAQVAQNTTGQPRHAAQHQKAGIVGQEMKVLGAAGVVPPDIMIPSGTLPGRSAKEQAGPGMAVAIANQILQILSDRTAMPQIVIMMEQALKQSSLLEPGGTADFDDDQWEHLGQATGCSIAWFQQRLFRQPFVPHPIGWSLSTRWQNDRATYFQFQQQGPSGHVFELPHAVAPIPSPSQFLAQSTSTPVRMSGHQLPDFLEMMRLNRPSLNDLCLSHAAECGRRRGWSPEQNTTSLTRATGRGPHFPLILLEKAEMRTADPAAV
jgi:hypothetical protein